MVLLFCWLLCIIILIYAMFIDINNCRIVFIFLEAWFLINGLLQNKKKMHIFFILCVILSQMVMLTLADIVVKNL